jgi:signal transduction histidine kinase
MPNEDIKQATLSILHLEDSVQDHLLVKREFQKSGDTVRITHVENLADFETAIRTQVFDVILADYHLPGFTALDAWQRLKDQNVHTPFILLSGAIGESAAVAAIQAGMSDYLPKTDLGKLPHVTQRAMAQHRILLAKELADRELAASEKRLASFAEHLQLTIEQERAAIAREIHDDIGGSLAAIRFDLSWLDRHTIESATRAHIQAATDMLQHAVQASQRIMLSLRPAVLDQGLVAAIRWLGENFSKRTGTQIAMQTHMRRDQLPKAIELTAYRTAQEALTNISKYAQCTQVKIELTVDEGFLTLEISDNGRGMEEADKGDNGGFGLRGLKERAKTVGGWLDISSKSGQGTSITLSIPMPDATNTTPEN